MKVGTDGVLLGAWFETDKSAPRILDVGTGTGLIALMAAQRFPDATIDAIEIDADAASQAADNVLFSPFSSKISVHRAALQEWHGSQLPDTEYRYDAIVSNPPFFDRSLRCPDAARATARHTDTLSDSVLVAHSARLLNPEGTFHVILPYAKKDGFIALLLQKRFFVTRITEVYPTPTSTPKRILLSARYCPFDPDSCTDTPPVIDSIVIELSRHQYSAQYIALTRHFYLKM